MKYYATRAERDRARRRSLSYRFKRWFFSNHKKEIKNVGIFIGELITTILFFSALLFLPHIFH